MHDVRYDEVNDEMLVTNPFARAIMVFRGGADGEEAPIRIIQGSNTMLGDPTRYAGGPDRVAVDAVHDEIFVPDGSRVLVFDRKANGNVAPIRVLQGPDTRMDDEGTLAVDPLNNVIAVAQDTVTAGSTKMAHILIFARTANGNTKPVRVIRGPNTQLGQLGGPHAVYPPTGRILVTIRSQGASGGLGERMTTDDGFVGVWSINDNGNVPPRWTIGGPGGVLQMVRGVAVNPKHKELIVTDKRLNAILTFYFPELFM